MEAILIEQTSTELLLEQTSTEKHEVDFFVMKETMGILVLGGCGLYTLIDKMSTLSFRLF